ncbi:hypothetical protein Calag_0330 [Caldisphaera lagunensis DSM 15908]|uniref:DUF424 domain-containing protein n=1 Tax=Caldisphaera lagunensis (strain DSM 15908 / JCM 11604 / ANMR 0165 / IC-154) TaxID=1056495 RepID=L0AAI7_CALLD|nr:DUF424 family protein [Caldisphaera lagunensis]AFZ70107.1 hypothetical protein Calag_0330 [Caldisphaera lagunensis DSM 15908]
MSYYINIINLETGEIMISMADKEIIGKKFEQRDGIVIDVDQNFYGSKLVDDEEALIYLKSADILILTGSKIVDMAIKEGIVNPDSVLEINGVKHVQVYKFAF